jgi:hypothetical protein
MFYRIQNTKKGRIMDAYYVNTNPQPNGDNEIHISICPWMPHISNRKFLGYFNNCHDALGEARKIYPNTSDGCHYCCPACDNH